MEEYFSRQCQSSVVSLRSSVNTSIHQMCELHAKSIHPALAWRRLKTDDRRLKSNGRIKSGQASVPRDAFPPTPPGPEGSNGNGLLRVQWPAGVWLFSGPPACQIWNSGMIEFRNDLPFSPPAFHPAARNLLWRRSERCLWCRRLAWFLNSDVPALC